MEFMESKTFTNWFKKLGLTDDDLRQIQNDIIENPNIGVIQQETGGIRKYRFSSTSNKGKSGGSRIHFYVYSNVCYLLAIVPKNVAENLSKSERDELVKLLHRMIRKEESLCIFEGGSYMKNMTLYDFLKSGIEDIIEYNNGDKSKAKKYTVKESEFAYEDVENDFKLRIKESSDE